MKNKTYEVTIQVTCEKVVQLEAGAAHEADWLVSDMFDEGEVTVDMSDLTSVKYNVVEIKEEQND